MGTFRKCTVTVHLSLTFDKKLNMQIQKFHFYLLPL